MTKAIWNGVVVAESDRTVAVEGNRYVPPAAWTQRAPKAAAAHFKDWLAFRNGVRVEA